MLTLFINSMMHAVMIDHISVYTTSEEVFYSGPRLHPLPSAAASTFFGLQPLNPVFSCATSAPMTWKNASSTPCWFTSNLIYRKPGNRCTGRSLTHSAANNKTRNRERGRSLMPINLNPLGYVGFRCPLPGGLVQLARNGWMHR
jgi:hypothetical protein